jgi:hypothetical protein
MVVRCPVGVSVSGIVIEVRVCGSDSVHIVKAVLWRVQCNMSRSRSNGEDIMVVQCPVKRLGIVRRDRSCMLSQWATIHHYITIIDWYYMHRSEYRYETQPVNLFTPLGAVSWAWNLASTLVRGASSVTACHGNI